MHRAPLIAKTDDIEVLYFDSHLTGDSSFAGLLIYSGVVCVRTIARPPGAVFEFVCPAEDWKIYEEEWNSGPVAVADAKAYASALMMIYNYRSSARKSPSGEFIARRL